MFASILVGAILMDPGCSLLAVQDSDEVVAGNRQPQVGDRSTVEAHVTSEIETEGDPQRESTQRVSQVIKTKTTVVEVTQGRVTSASVEVLVDQFEFTDEYGVHEIPSDVEGRTFLVQVVGGDFAIQDADGQPVDPGTHSRLEINFASFRGDLLRTGKEWYGSARDQHLTRDWSAVITPPADPNPVTGPEPPTLDLTYSNSFEVGGRELALLELRGGGVYSSEPSDGEAGVVGAHDQYGTARLDLGTGWLRAEEFRVIALSREAVSPGSRRPPVSETYTVNAKVRVTYELADGTVIDGDLAETFDSFPPPLPVFELVPPLETTQPRLRLFLAQEEEETGSHLVLLSRAGPWSPWTTELLEGRGTNQVVKEARAFRTFFGVKGIVTIGSGPTLVQFWQPTENAWRSRTVWARSSDTDPKALTDLEIADVTGDTIDDLVVTAADGTVALIKHDSTGYSPQVVVPAVAGAEAYRCDVVDFDVDGKAEIVYVGASIDSDSGHLVSHLSLADHGEEGWSSVLVDRFPDTPVHEVLAADLDGDDISEVYVPIQVAKDRRIVLRRYRWRGGGIESDDVHQFKGSRCRNLVCGDTDGDSIDELFASTYRNGIYRIDPSDQGWSHTKLISFFHSQSREHAMVLVDTDGNDRLELFAVSDEPSRVHRFEWDSQKGLYVRTLINAALTGSLTYSIGLLED